jgi:HTH-type transcriptional regulator/antitoxin HigA
MSAVKERPLDLKSVKSAWQGLNRLVPLVPIVSEKDYQRRIRVMDDLLGQIGADESHPLISLLDLITKQIGAYEAEHHALPEVTPAAVLRYLMEEHGLKQVDLADELGGQSIVSAVLRGKRDLNARQTKALAKRFNVSPAVFL